MRAAFRPLLVFASVVLVLSGSLPGHPASASPGSNSSNDARELRTAAAPQELQSSVVVRPNPEVTTASEDPSARAADRYVVSFRDDVADPLAVADALGARLGFSATHVYQRSPKGFAARLSAGALAAVKTDPRVTAAVPDTIIPYALFVPTGVSRIGTQLNATAKLDGIDGSGQRVNADVAVIDTGVDATHPDLNVAGGADCTGLDDPYFDEAGHGTHVAGTIGALDDGVGVVGVAPGVRLWSIKVSDAYGAYLSWYLCGLAALADNADWIEVANISLGGSGSDGTCASSDEHQLICDAVNGGVTIVVAAGNDGASAASFAPATFSQVITVSALVDTDGKIGGKGPGTSVGADDTFASFSNYGADVDLAAPGVNILSTWPTYFSGSDGYEYLSGTSMAAPHVAGAAALYIARNGRVGPSKVKSALQANSDTGGMKGDPDSTHERVLYVGAIAPSCTLSPTSGTVGKTVTVTCTKFRANESVSVYWGSTSTERIAAFVASSSGSGSKTFKIPAATKGTHNVISRGGTSGKRTTDTLGVTPSVTLGPASGAQGDSVKVTLRGFVKGEKITVKWSKTSTSTVTLKSGLVASSTGGASFTFTVPAGTTGGHKVAASGSAGSTASATFTLQATTAASVEEATPTTSSTPARPPRRTATPTAGTEPASETPATATPTPEPAATETSTPEPTAVPDAPPIAQAGPDQTILDGDASGDEAVSLDGSASRDPEEGALTAEWRIDGRVVATDLVASVTLPIGTHTVVLTVTDAAGATASDGVLIVVAPAPESRGAATEISPTAGSGDDAG